MPRRSVSAGHCGYAGICLACWQVRLLSTPSEAGRLDSGSAAQRLCNFPAVAIGSQYRVGVGGQTVPPTHAQTQNSLGSGSTGHAALLRPKGAARRAVRKRPTAPKTASHWQCPAVLGHALRGPRAAPACGGQPRAGSTPLKARRCTLRDALVAAQQHANWVRNRAQSP